MKILAPSFIMDSLRLPWASFCLIDGLSLWWFFAHWILCIVLPIMTLYDLLWPFHFCIVYRILFIFVLQRMTSYDLFTFALCIKLFSFLYRSLLWPPAIPCLGILKAISSRQKWCSTETSWIGIPKTLRKNNISCLHFLGKLLSIFRTHTSNKNKKWIWLFQCKLFIQTCWCYQCTNGNWYVWNYFWRGCFTFKQSK